MHSHQPHFDRKKRGRLMRLATMASIAAATSIVLVKVVAWLITDSLSLLSSLVDSVLDILASLVTFAAVRYALRPADDDHRFGHGKAEDIAAFAQSAFIAGSGLFIGIEAIKRLIQPHPLEHHMVGIGVMLFSIVVTLCLLVFQHYVIARTHSTAIKADALHYRSDLFVNLAVIIAFLGSWYFQWEALDPLFALGIAFYVFHAAWKVGRGAFDNLMDKEFPDEQRNKIIQAVLEHKHVLGVHDLRTRGSGATPFIQFHLELKGDLKLRDAHRISHEVEEKVLTLFPHAEITIHQDPEPEAPLSLEIGRAVPIERRGD